jgi:hypothetical protein
LSPAGTGSISGSLDFALPLTAVELGAGTGIVTLQLMDALTQRGRCGDLLVMTDLPEVCELLKENMRTHAKVGKAHELLVCPLAWGNREHAQGILGELAVRGRELTHIICSDLVRLSTLHLALTYKCITPVQVYFPALLAPLLRTLLHLTSAGSNIEVVIAYKIRSLAKESPFWSAFGLWFEYEPVLLRQRPVSPQSAAEQHAGVAEADQQNYTCDNDYGRWERFGMRWDGPTFVFAARRRLLSFGWEVPLNDAELLAGVEAKGTKAPKEDGTFEELLFMNLHNDEEDQ